jgi:hypothetical protein
MFSATKRDKNKERDTGRSTFSYYSPSKIEVTMKHYSRDVRNRQCQHPLHLEGKLFPQYYVADYYAKTEINNLRFYPQQCRAGEAM